MLTLGSAQNWSLQNDALGYIYLLFVLPLEQLLQGSRSRLTVLCGLSINLFSFAVTLPFSMATSHLSMQDVFRGREQCSATYSMPFL